MRSLEIFFQRGFEKMQTGLQAATSEETEQLSRLNGVMQAIAAV